MRGKSQWFGEIADHDIGERTYRCEPVIIIQGLEPSLWRVS